MPAFRDDASTFAANIKLKSSSKWGWTRLTKLNKTLFPSSMPLILTS